VLGSPPSVMIALVSAGAYWTSIAVGLCACAVISYVARVTRPRWRYTVARIIGCVLVGDILAYSVGLALAKTWSWSTSLPLALCNMGVLVAAVACWFPRPLLVELTYYLGLAGALQAVVTPDLTSPFPHLVFFEFVVGHVGIVFAAVFLVVGLHCRPRRGSVLRVFWIGCAYTAFVGLVDGLTNANYMFLRLPPAEWTLLSALGPWPWYVVSAAGVALALFSLLDLPFALLRRRETRRSARAVLRG
jgi:hypothetical integral membrane protein (TIGR02206 family)